MRWIRGGGQTVDRFKCNETNHL